MDFSSSASVASGNLNHSQTLFTIELKTLKRLHAHTTALILIAACSEQAGHIPTTNLKLNTDNSLLSDGDGREQFFYSNGTSYIPELSPYPVLIKMQTTHTHSHIKTASMPLINQGSITSIQDRDLNPQ